MTSASEIEKRFRNKPELFTLKKHELQTQSSTMFVYMLLVAVPVRRACDSSWTITTVTTVTLLVICERL